MSRLRRIGAPRKANQTVGPASGGNEERRRLVWELGRCKPSGLNDDHSANSAGSIFERGGLNLDCLAMVH